MSWIRILESQSLFLRENAMVKKREYSIKTANFVCRFGSNFVLLDLLNEVVIPAFTTPSYIRTYGDTTHFFHDPQVVIFKRGSLIVPCIIGQYIKDTVLERDQIFNRETNSLIQDSVSIKSAPSSIFILTLDSHKLMFLPETKNAPGIDAFATTARSCLHQAHIAFIDQLYKNPDETFVSKKELLERYPRPSVDVIPLASSESLDSFIEHFALLQEVSIELIKPNNNLDNSELFHKLRTTVNNLDATKTTLSYENRKHGLSPSEVSKQLSAAVTQGNSIINLRGKSTDGNTLSGSNDKFLVQYTISAPLGDLQSAASKIFTTVFSHVQWEVEHLSDEAMNKLKELYDKFTSL
jgi:hypothetical protein